jgi:hypothetical protein
LKSLKSVTVRKPLVVEIGVIRQLLDALRYRKTAYPLGSGHHKVSHQRYRMRWVQILKVC